MTQLMTENGFFIKRHSCIVAIQRCKNMIIGACGFLLIEIALLHVTPEMMQWLETMFPKLSCKLQNISSFRYQCASPVSSYPKNTCLRSLAVHSLGLSFTDHTGIRLVYYYIFCKGKILIVQTSDWILSNLLVIRSTTI